MKDISQKVYEYLTTIPKGKVVTYSQIARHLDIPKASRAIGNILHANKDPIKYPCFKVVNRNGDLAKHFGNGIEVQKQRLINDGVEVIDYKVDLNKYQYKPELKDMSISELWYLFPIYLVPHKDSWLIQYKKEEKLLSNYLNNCPVLSINHIGSTSINNIYAKDIVDILIEIDDDNLLKYAKILSKYGYNIAYVEDDHINLNKGYTKDGFAPEVFHIHLKRKGDLKEVYFRDYMNAHPKKAKEYERVKLELAKKYRNNRNGYTEAKTPFIKRCKI